jgi:hypothetical protein
MPDRINIDLVHSRAMCTEIGERLRDILAREHTEFPASITAGVDRLREQEQERAPKTNSRSPPWFYGAAIGCIYLERPADPSGEQIDRTFFGVVGGVSDELIIEAELDGGGQSVAIIGFDDLLQAWMRQVPRPIANDDA